MAYKMRKCDRIKQEKAKPPKKECCPICELPAGDGTHSTCSFFERVATLKIEDMKLYFDTFHADVCKNCKKTVEECRKYRLIAVRKKLTRMVAKRERDSAYAEPEELKKLVDEQACPTFVPEHYTPIKPSWYLP